MLNHKTNNVFRVLSGKQNEPDNSIEFRVSKNGIVVLMNDYFIPSNKLLLNEWLIINHDNQSRVELQKTYKLLTWLFYWRNLFNDVQDYVRQ